MPKYKVQGQAREEKSGFEPYDGPEPTKRGMYRAVLKKLIVREYDSGSVAFRGLYELEAAKGDPKKHKQFDGAPFWANVFFVTATMPMKDGSQRALNNFLKALGVKDNPDIVTEDGEPNSSSGVAIKSIGGKKIAGIEGKTFVTVELQNDNRGEGYGLEVSNVYPAKDVEFTESDEDDEDEDTEDEVDEDSEEITAEEREEELGKLKLAELRKIAESDHDIEIKGLKKDDLIGAILDAEFGEAEDEDEEAEDEEDEEDSEDEVEEDDEEEEDDEDEEDDDEERDARTEELAGLNRVQLKKALKEANPEFTPLKRHSDDDLREAILEAEFGGDETPF